MRHIYTGHLDLALFNLPYIIRIIPLKATEQLLLLDEEGLEGSVLVELMDNRKCSHSLAGTDHAVPEARPPIAYKSTSRHRSSPISKYICPRECHCFKAVGKRESESRMEFL